MAKMLIADDNKQITSILSNYARKEGFEPVVALDGEEALRLFDEHEPDIAMVLLDVMMPKVDGFEVCRRLRGKSLVPVIMVTARGEDFEKIMGLRRRRLYYKAFQRGRGDGTCACNFAPHAAARGKNCA